MKRLLQIEFIKLWNNRASRILILSYFILLTSIALIAAIKFDIGPVKFHLAEQGIFNFPYIWHFNTFITAFFKLFLAIVIVSMMANEYSNKTIKQNLIDGLSKKEFIYSKFLTVISFALISTIFVFVVSMVLGLIYSDYDELSIIFSDLEFLLAFFIKLVGFFSFCLFLGMLVKRSAFALGFLFLWQVIEGIGGANGWYSWSLAWGVRGLMDRLSGGPGLRRGRRDPARRQYRRRLSQSLLGRLRSAPAGEPCRGPRTRCPRGSRRARLLPQYSCRL